MYRMIKFYSYSADILSKIVYRTFCPENPFSAGRAKLSGMLIIGAPSLAKYFTIYTDISNTSSCDSYGTSGSSVCDDVILIPITSTTQIPLLAIQFPQTANEIILCEVQVFGGKFFMCITRWKNLTIYIFIIFYVN